LLFRARRRDRFLAHRKRLFAYACAISGEREVAVDLIQDCAVRVFDARKVPADEPAFRAWLFKIVRNLWLDGLRRTNRRKEVPIEEAPEWVAMPVPAETMIVNALAVRLAFEMLSDDHRDVLALVDVGGFSYEETAALLDVPRGTVMSRVSRGRAALARLLDQDNVIEMPTRRAGKTS
jgi:RNA polymerase sigma-70 factor (ECF subfamily)